MNKFFEGNAAEDSIAPNDWEYGRPSISEIWDIMRNLERTPNIGWIRVALHNDTEITVVISSAIFSSPDSLRIYRYTSSK